MDGRMKYLAMRAKKMTARQEVLPTADELRARFIAKSTEVTKAEAEILLEEVRAHRVKQRTGGAESPAVGAERGSKPKPRPEVSVPTPPKTYSRSYGR